jgi:PST family polysaccharide transporter
LLRRKLQKGKSPTEVGTTNLNRVEVDACGAASGSLREEAARALVWSGVSKWGSYGLTFIYFVVITRLLLPEDFGLFTLAGVCMAFIQLFSDQGFSDAIVQHPNLTPGHKDTAFWINLAVSAVLALLCMALARPLAGAFGEPRLAALLACLSGALVLSAFGAVQAALLRRQLAFKALAYCSFGSVLAGSAVGVTMALLGWGVWSLVGQQLAGVLVRSLALWRVGSWRPGTAVSAKCLRELSSYGFNIVGLNLLSFINLRSDQLLIGWLLGPVSLGYYSIGRRALTMLNDFLYGTVAPVAFSAFSRIQGEPGRMADAFYELTRAVATIALPVLVGLVCVAPELVPVLLGETWRPSVPLVRVFALMGIAHSIYYLGSETLLKAVGRPFLRFALNIAHALTNLLAFILMVRFGILAVAIAYVVRGYILWPIDFLVLARFVPIRLPAYLRSIRAPAAGSLLMAVCVLAVRYGLSTKLEAAPLLAVSVAVGALVYVLIAAILMPDAAALASAAWKRLPGRRNMSPAP